MNSRIFVLRTGVLLGEKSQAVRAQVEVTAREARVCKPQAGDGHAH